MSDEAVPPAEVPKKHEHLEEEMYYETKPIGKSRMVKWCEHCGALLPIGSSQDVHTFYPEYTAYPTHKECSEAFLASLN